MGGFGFPINRGGLPQNPSIAPPQPGSRGGIMPAMPGLAPYQQNPYAEAAKGIGQFLMGLSQAEELRKQKAKQEFNDQLQLSSATGIPYDPQHMAKLAKKAGYKIDTENPLQTISQFVGPVQQPQASMVPQQQNTLNLGGQQQGPPDPGVPQQATVQMPDFQRQQIAQVGVTPPPSITINQPGQSNRNFLQKMTDRIGITSAPVGANSPGVQQMAALQQQMQMARQNQGMLNSAQAQAAMAEAQNKVGMAQRQGQTNRMLASYQSGVDVTTGKPLTPEQYSQLGMTLRRTIDPATKKPVLESLESDKLTDLLSMANDNAQPRQIRDAFNAQVNHLTGQDTVNKNTADLAAKWAADGTYSTIEEARANAARLMKGQPLLSQGKMPVETVSKYVENMGRVLDQFPELGDPKMAKLREAVNPYILSGNIGPVYGVLAQSGLRSKAALQATQDTMKLDLERQQVGIARQNANTAAGGLALRQREFGYQQAKDQRDFAAQQRKESIVQGLQQFGVNLDIKKATGEKLSPGESNEYYKVLEGLTKTGKLDYIVGGVVTEPGWGIFADPQVTGVKAKGAADLGQRTRPTVPAAPASPFTVAPDTEQKQMIQRLIEAGMMDPANLR